MLLAAAGGQAQEAAQLQQSQRGRPLTVQPSASITETLTDNALLRDSDKRTEAITQLTAGVAATLRADRVSGVLDYQLTGTVHARETKADKVGQSLRSTLSAVLIDELFYLDGSASIGRQAISAFGTQDVGRPLDNENSTEVRSLSLTPSLRGRIGDNAVFDARVNFTKQSSEGSNRGDLTTRTDTLSVGARPGVRLGWNASVTRGSYKYKDGSNTHDSRALVGLTYQPDPSWRFSANAGREENDITTLGTRNNTTWGVGLQWVPSPRTQLAATRDHRFFGEAHSISFTHREPRTTWRFTSSRDLQSAQPNQVSTLLHDVYQLLFDMLASRVPDPVARRDAVLRVMEQEGIPASAVVTSAFLNSAVTLVSRQELAFGYQGIRSSALLTMYRSDTRRVDGRSSAIDDLSTDPAVRQHGALLTLSHRLTPASGISLTLTWQRNRGASQARNNELSSASLNWTTRLGPHSNLALGARHVEFDTALNPYNENAVFATLGVRF
ncbi:TIGR03016 family PEP-CTERM system-associated outer membrane protein [Aquincola sp. S2]|uniref:TIGR03016 family PEP-CTERM system-associated outer membrane protein n=1 Tax=Pseudaquabacterium terrae TaxID=2732868 RepID=A0ABX2ED45_9BURK|nr:TIGR03016 family PEP-CTERM system-associated outer membrane protein [Aquabacterium terrae]NRF66494.1 TIGR03016 family PEP-CTERM system-associated outer membrane protein [Aquabacterium terrae]